MSTSRDEEEHLTCRLLDVIEEVAQTVEELIPSAHHKQHWLQESKHSVISSTDPYINICVCVCVHHLGCVVDTEDGVAGEVNSLVTG